jgi:site-specific DNA recombinase
MARARIYGRRSDDDQSTFSPDAQQRQCRTWCAQQGHDVVGVYFDDDMSGRRADRPELQRMIAEAKADPSSIVVVHKFDRLGRDSIDALTIIYRELKPKRVRVESVMERVDAWTPLGRMVVTQSFGIANYFSDNLATEITKGLAEKAEKGGAVGPVSYGYDWEYQRDAKGDRVRGTGQLKPTPDAPTVAHMFARYATACYSDLTLAQELNRDGYTFCRRGRLSARVPFTADTVGGVLSNRIYLGEVTYHGEQHPGAHEPIVDRELFERVQAIRLQRKRAGRHQNRETPRAASLLSEIAYCGHCGRRLHLCASGRQTSRTLYYRCAAKRNEGTCDAPMVRTTLADPWALDVLRELTIPPHIRDAAIALAQQHLAQPPATATDAAQIPKRLSALKALFKLGDMSEAEYLRERANLQAQLASAPPPPAQTLDVERAARLLGDMGTLLEAATAEHQRALVHTVFATVWITKDGIRAIRPAPSYRVLVSVVARGDAENVTLTGLEPVTSSSGGWRSIQLSYRATSDATDSNIATGACQGRLRRWRAMAKSFPPAGPRGCSATATDEQAQDTG